MKPGETLEYAPEPRARALTCWGLIRNGAPATGWLCSDEGGVYRTAMDGQLASARWQLMADEAWVINALS